MCELKGLNPVMQCGCVDVEGIREERHLIEETELTSGLFNSGEGETMALWTEKMHR